MALKEEYGFSEKHYSSDYSVSEPDFETDDPYDRSGQTGLRLYMANDCYLIGYRLTLGVNCYENKNYNPYNYLQFHLFEILDETTSNVGDSWYYSNLMAPWTYRQIPKGSLCITANKGESFAETIGLASNQPHSDSWVLRTGITNVFYLPEPIRLYKDKIYQVGASAGPYLHNQGYNYKEGSKVAWYISKRGNSLNPQLLADVKHCSIQYVDTGNNRWATIVKGTKEPVCTRANGFINLYEAYMFDSNYHFNAYGTGPSSSGHPAIIIEPLFLTFDYRYLIKNNIPTQKTITNVLSDKLSVKQNAKGEWCVKYNEEPCGTAVAFNIIPGVRYKLEIPKDVNFIYAGTCDKKILNDVHMGEERPLNTLIYNEDVVVNDKYEISFTAQNNDRGFVAYFNRNDVIDDLGELECIGTGDYRLYAISAILGTTNFKAVEIEGEETFDLSAKTFLKSESKIQPTAEMLTDIAYPGIAYWQEYEDDNPVLQLTISGTPKAQYVTSKEISLYSDGKLCNISKMQVESNGGVLLQFSFNSGVSWKYFQPTDAATSLIEGEWVEITDANKWNGQSKTVTEALTLEQWRNGNSNNASSYLIRAVFSEASQTLSRIGVTYA